MEATDKLITITLSVGEMGAASVALDKYVNDQRPTGGIAGCPVDDFVNARERFDKIYRAWWQLENNGVSL